MKAKKILIFLLVILLLVFYASNFTSIYTIDDLAYVIGIGFDNGTDGAIRLSLQIAIPISGEQSGTSSQSKSSIVKTIECNTINSGINLINSYVSKKLNLSYCKVVVFSEDISSKNIINYACTLINDIEVRPYCNVLISRCEASYFLENSEPLLDKLSSKYYKTETSSERNTGYTEQITLLQFYNDYYDTLGEPHAVLSEITSATTEKNHIENFGLVTFHNGTLTGELSGVDTVYHLIITNQLQNTIISVPSPFNDYEYIALHIDGTHAKNKVKIVNGFPYITCDVRFNTRVLSSSVSSNYLTKENIAKIEDYANSYFKSHLEDYLYKTSLELKSDISKFGRYAVRSFLTFDDWKKYDWINKYPNSTFNVKVKTNLKSSYLIVGTS